MKPHYSWMYGCAAVLAAALCLESARAEEKIPAFDLIEKTVRASLAERSGYRAGDLLSRDQMDKAFQSLEKVGWKVATRAEIVALTPADSEPMPTALKTKQGQSLMRRLKGSADAYDRLDRLSQLPDGKQILRRLTTEPGGEKLVEYMLTPGGAEMGRMLSKTKTRDFSKPTGRIYIEKQFLAALKSAYDARGKTPAPGAAKK